MAIVTIPLASYPVGTYSLGPASVDLGITQARVSLSRDNWLDPNVKVSARFDLSLDGGATWSPDPDGRPVWPWGHFPCFFTAEGGAKTNAFGQPITTSSVGCDAPEPDNPNRRVRASITVTGGTLTTAITITAS